MNNEHIVNINNLLNSLIDDASYSINDDIIYQIKYMNSDTLNNDLDAIYDRLNRLYEKTRYLYDLSDTIEYSLKEYIAEISSEINTTLKTIESQRDLLKRNTDLVFNVSFKNEYDSDFTDRDGSAIESRAFLTNSILTLPSVDIYEATNISDNLQINQYNSFKAYNYQNFNELENNGIYRTLYCSSSPIGVKEKVSIVFNTPIKMNSFDLALSNCTYQNLVYIFDNDSRVSINDISSISTTRLLTGIEFDIVCSKPTINTYSVPESTNTDTYLNGKKKELYSNWSNKLQITADQIKDYSNHIETYDEIQKKYGYDGFYNDDQSIENQLNRPTESISSIEAFKFSNPYPIIETARAYGDKEI